MRLQLQIAGSVSQAVEAATSHELTIIEARQVKPYGVTVIEVEPWPESVAVVRAWFEEWRDTKVGPTAPGDLLHWALVDR